MKSAMGQKNYLAVTLSFVLVLLVGLLYWEWDQGMRLEKDLLKLRKIPVTPVPVKAVLPEFVLPAADTGFPELISRPLFTASRHASVSSAKGGIAAMKKGQFVLVGVLITPAQKSALLRDVQTKKTETVARAGLIRGLTLGEVEPTRVVLRQGAESEELTLSVQTGPNRPIAAPTPAALAPSAPVAVAKPPMPPASAASSPAPGASALQIGSPVKPVDTASAPKGPTVHVEVKK